MTALSITDLSALSDEDFLEVVRANPRGCDWLYAESFRYSATRLARLQGLSIREHKAIEKA